MKYEGYYIMYNAGKGYYDTELGAVSPLMHSYIM